MGEGLTEEEGGREEDDLVEDPVEVDAGHDWLTASGVGGEEDPEAGTREGRRGGGDGGSWLEREERRTGV